MLLQSQSLKSINIIQQFRYFNCSCIIFKSPSSNRWLNRQNSDYFTKRAKVENYKSRAAFKLLQIEERFHIFNKSHNKNKPLNVLDLGAAPGAWNQVALDRCPKRSKILGVDILPYQPPNGASTIQGNILSKSTHEQIKDFFLLSILEKNDKVFQEIEILSSNDSSITNEKKSSISNKDNDDQIIEADFSIIDKELESNKLIESNSDSLNSLTSKYPVDVILSDMYEPFIRDSGFSNATTNNPYIRMANTTGLAFKDHVMSMDLCDAALITAVDLLKKNGNLVIKFFTGEEDKLLEQRLKYVFKDVKRFKPKACRVESRECYFICLGKREYEIDKVELFSKKF